MKDSQCTSAASQANRAQKSKGNSPIGKPQQRRQAHKSDGALGFSDHNQVQVNGYRMGSGDGKGNY